jgi:hypothetical protein
MKHKSVTPANHKQAEIDAANAAYAKNRVAILDARLGAGIGAKRERSRLTKYLQPEGKP